MPRKSKTIRRKAKPAARPQTIREQEGFARAVGIPKGGVPACSSLFSAHGYSLNDHRGDITGGSRNVWFKYPPHFHRHSVEWETTPAKAKQTTTFAWIGGSLARPALRPAYPYDTATLYIDGVARLKFAIGRVEGMAPTGDIVGFTSRQDGFELYFEPRRFQSLVETAHRNWMPHGVSGVYRLTVPGKYLKAGKPLRLRVELPPAQPDTEFFFFVSPRRDALRSSVDSLREEVLQLQHDLVQLTRSHETLYAQVYPQLFPRRVKAERFVAHQDDTKHLHPAQVTVMRDDEIVVTAREGSDHLAPDGRIILVRSKDGGRTWSPKEVMYDLGNSDHRSAPITELANGDWVTLDYRAGGEYNKQGIWEIENWVGPSLWPVWSTDRGRTWTFGKDPVSVPGAHPMAEIERHLIQLPGGRLLAAVGYLEYGPDGKVAAWDTSWQAVFRSDNNGRSWQLHSKLPYHPCVIGEPTILRTKSGKLLILARSEAWRGQDWHQQGMLYQTVSTDEGKTWSELQPTAMSSMSSPGHLLQLQDGRILCTHASRNYPGSVYATVSRDEGETWDTANTHVLANDIVNYDSCYPNTGQMADGTLITVWYANLFGKFFIPALRWRPEEL